MMDKYSTGDASEDYGVAMGSVKDVKKHPAHKIPPPKHDGTKLGHQAIGP